MVSKNDLSALKIQPKNTLEKLQQMQEQSQAGIELPLGSKAWRKPLPEADKQTELVGLRFTKTELEAIKKQAGLVPVASYIKHQIKTQNWAIWE